MFNEFLTPLKLYLWPTFEVILSLWFLWLPVLMIIVFINFWLRFKREEFHFKQGFILLEIRMPKEISKSPQAMEAVMDVFYQTFGESTFIDRIFHGKTRPWFSLEIVSLEGSVKMFIWMRKGSKGLVESQIYAHYPNVEVHEVPDYTLPVYSDPEVNTVWGCDFTLAAPDHLPIKTYVDYGLDRDIDEELKVDPLSSLFEFLGSLGKGEQIWIQILVRAHRKEIPKKGTFFGKVDWKEAAEKAIEKLREKSFFELKDGKKQPSQTEGIKTTISAIERSISKLPFDCGMRGIYIAQKENFNPANIGGLLGFTKAFSWQNLNGFKPTGGMINFNYPWKDYADIRKNQTKKELIDAYKRRSYFHPPYKNKPFILNTEELATLFHFPGQVAATPNLARVPSRKAEAPSNLPI